MARYSCWLFILLLISVQTSGKCRNEPKVALSSTTGKTCGLSAILVSGNTFGGSADIVYITSDGAGTVNPSTATSSPFTFSYTPQSGDLGKMIRITVTTNDPKGKDCVPSRITYTLVVYDNPPAPETSTTVQPTCLKPTGSVSLQRLPPLGTWELTRLPDRTKISGTGTTMTISGLSQGSYSFYITNSSGCASPLSKEVTINPVPPAQPVKVNDPLPVCYPSTVDITAASVTMGSAAGIAYTYWKNSSATISYTTPQSASDGIYYIKGTDSNGCSDIKPVKVTVNQRPYANAGTSQVLDYKFETELKAEDPGKGETGLWSVLSGSGIIADKTDASTTVSKLSTGKNIFQWTISNGTCQPSSDTVSVLVKDLVIPTLITPNMDGKNDYFIIGLDERLGRTELIIFDRRGVQVFKSLNYDNGWNGVDLNGNPLEDDTYFYLLNPEKGKTQSGYIVIRR
jgi:gliding motility-associated-like protein